MRGHVRFRAERSPYRRAELQFGEDRVREVPANELTGERLLILARDPALRVDFWDGGTYVPYQAHTGDNAAERAQGFLDLLADALDAPAAPEAAADGSTAKIAELEAAHGRLADALEVRTSERDQLRDELAARRAALVDFLEAREGFLVRSDETPEAAAIRVITELDAELAAARAGGGDTGDRGEGGGSPEAGAGAPGKAPEGGEKAEAGSTPAPVKAPAAKATPGKGRRPS